MKVKNKQVYYCEFCRKHNLTSNAMKNHELHCTKNPNRECRMCDRKGIHDFNISEIEVSTSWNGEHSWEYSVAQSTSIDKALIDDCPACMLAYLRINKIQSSYDFKKACEKFWREKNDDGDEENYYL